METGNALVLIAAVIAASMVVQAIAVVVFLLSLKKRMERLETTVNDFLTELRPIMQSANEFLTDTKEFVAEAKLKVAAVMTKAEAIASNIADISVLAKSQVRRLDGMLTDASDHARLQLIRLDQLMQGALGRIEETGDLVRRAIVTPVREMSALITGLKSSVDFLFRRNRARRNPIAEDEELFI